MKTSHRRIIVVAAVVVCMLVPAAGWAQTMLDPERVHRLLHEMDLETRRNALHGLMLLSDAANALIRRRRAFADAANQGGVL